MKLTLLNGQVLEVEKGVNGFDVAKLLSSTLAKKSLVYRLNDKLYDLRTPLIEDGSFNLITSDDQEALEFLNHTASHLLAHAVLNLYPGALIGFGPAIKDGFYYDIDFLSPINDDDLIKIENEMNKIA